MAQLRAMISRIRVGIIINNIRLVVRAIALAMVDPAREPRLLVGFTADRRRRVVFLDNSGNRLKRLFLIGCKVYRRPKLTH